MSGQARFAYNAQMDPTKNWQAEKQSAYLYRVLAAKENNQKRKELFTKLSKEAEHQATIWEAKFTPGLSPTHFTVGWRVHLVAGLIRLLGPKPLRGILAAMKVRGMSAYTHAVGSHEMPDDLSQVGSRHKGRGAGNWLRASIFGINDGLVSNTSLILGVTGAALDAQAVLFSGVAGMLAGAFSMACGEYISVQSQREFFEKQIGVEKEELENYPEEEAAELALIFEARGLPKEDAKRNALTLISDPSKALDTLAREELGINPNDLGSALTASISSFLSFLIGAILPLVPFYFQIGTSPVLVAIGLAIVTLFGVGATLSLFTGRSAIYGGLRMLLLGATAGACTYAIGRSFGV